MMPSLFSGRFYLTLGLATTLLLGCSEDEAGPPKTATAFCEQWGKASCSKLAIEHCNSPDAETCIEYQQDYCLTLVDESDYSAAGAESCIAGVRRAYDDAKLTGEERDMVLNLNGACDHVLSGETRAGGDCKQDRDCNVEENFECVLRLTESGEVSGQCEISEEASGGRSCKEPHVVCADGFYCDGNNCLSNAEEDDECSAMIPCDEGLNCDSNDPEVSGLCRPKGAIRDACKVDADCESKLCTAAANGNLGCASSLLLDFGKSICDDFGPPVEGGNSEKSPSENTEAEQEPEANAQIDKGPNDDAGASSDAGP